jgi:cyclopropane fatty-acyl-phospholipid synthase-like methyltransferase
MVKLIITDENSLPSHLGGHENETHTDEGVVDYLIKTFDVKSVIDVGCGPGGMRQVWVDRNVEWFGVDGDYQVERTEDVKNNMTIHDYSTAPYTPNKKFDLAWSVEFLEHVDAHYIYNFMETLRSAKYALVTHAFPGQPGHHHVNCQEHPYWINIFTAFGFEIDQEQTNLIREASTMRERYIRQQSLFFKNRNA